MRIEHIQTLEDYSSYWESYDRCLDYYEIYAAEKQLEIIEMSLMVHDGPFVEGIVGDQIKNTVLGAVFLTAAAATAAMSLIASIIAWCKRMIDKFLLWIKKVFDGPKWDAKSNAFIYAADVLDQYGDTIGRTKVAIEAVIETVQEILDDINGKLKTIEISYRGKNDKVRITFTKSNELMALKAMSSKLEKITDRLYNADDWYPASSYSAKSFMTEIGRLRKITQDFADKTSKALFAAERKSAELREKISSIPKDEFGARMKEANLNDQIKTLQLEVVDRKNLLIRINNIMMVINSDVETFITEMQPRDKSRIAAKPAAAIA